MRFNASVQDLGSRTTGILRAYKQVIIELRPIAEEHHHLVGLKEEDTLKRVARRKV